MFFKLLIHDASQLLQMNLFWIRCKYYFFYKAIEAVLHEKAGVRCSSFVSVSQGQLLYTRPPSTLGNGEGGLSCVEDRRPISTCESSTSRMKKRDELQFQALTLYEMKGRGGLRQINLLL